MKPLDLAPAQAQHVLAALNEVALADGSVADAERELLAIHAELLGFTGDLSAIGPLQLDALSAAIPDPAHRAALVQRLVLMAMLDGQLKDAEIVRAREIATHLGVSEPAIHQMEMLLAGRIRLLSFDIARRSFVASKIKDVWRHEGLRGMVKIADQARGQANPALAALYLAFEQLPPATLGRELFDHFRRNSFALPGEEKSAPEALLFHDIGHVLAGYGTDPEGEVQMAGFEAGYMGEDGFSITVFTLYVFHLGVDLLPTVEPTRGRFSFEAFRQAFRRGTTLNRDLRYWDASPFFGARVEDVRFELGMS